MPRISPLKHFVFNYKKYECNVPRVPIRFVGTDGKSTPPIEAVLDSGADQVTIPKDFADILKLSLKPRKDEIITANGPCHAFSSKAHFFLGRGGREVEYNDEEICVMENCPAILVGICPIFEDYIVRIDAASKKFTLEIK